jgi:hypothetical protein
MPETPVKSNQTAASGFQWWRDLPQWIQVIVAVATLLLGAVGTVLGLHATGSSPQHRAPSANTGPSSTPSTSVSTSTAPTSTTVRWHGPITIGWFGIELDALPPTASTGTSSYTIRDQSGELTSNGSNGTYAQWAGSSAPSYDQCHSWVLTNGNNSSSLLLTSGMQICVLTRSGRTAYVNITSLSSDSSAAHAQAIVWNQ